jgi:hypothetical protein
MEEKVNAREIKSGFLAYKGCFAALFDFLTKIFYNIFKL